MAKPSIVLVHGSWHSPKHGAPLLEYLEAQGYRCVAVDLPSMRSPDMPPATLTDDTAAVRSAVETELGQGRDVVVVAHSYGGVPTNNALEGFDTNSRSTQGASNSVIAVAFLTAFTIAAETSMWQAIGSKENAMHDRRGTEDFFWVGGQGPEYYFYNDLSHEEAQKWSALLRTQSKPAYLESTTYAAYRDLPSSYLFCTKDQAIPHAYQQMLVDNATKDGGQFGHLETVDSSHSPFLSMVERTGEFIRRAAGENDL